MSPLSKAQKENLIERTVFIEDELKSLERFKNFTSQEYRTKDDERKILDRTIELVMNACIDVVKILLAGEDIKIPPTYKEFFEKAGNAGILKQETALAIGSFVDLRNILAHEYLDMDWVKIKKFLTEGMKVLPEFIDEVKKILKQ